MPDKREKFYITTAIDYVNDTIHVGHAFQKLVADVLARYHRLSLGNDNVFFLTGTDEYGQKPLKVAADEGASVKEFVDRIAASDKQEIDSLGISYSRFIRTTDEDHREVAQEIWKRAEKAGDIYLGEFQGLYCAGCEAYYTDDDLVDGKCPFHPNIEIQTLREENFFFRWSKYQDLLVKHLEEHPRFVMPQGRYNEMLAFAKKGIRDIPISRTSFDWGVPVPGHKGHVMYVWFDALTNYLTGVGFLKQPQRFQKFWPADIHILGKDNVRWHALLWPAMLKSSGIELPQAILVNGFLNLNGQKISKSLGNVIRPSQWVGKFGQDAVRYYLLRYTTVIEDSDISEAQLSGAYESDLANGIGNLVARVLTLGEKYGKKKFSGMRPPDTERMIDEAWREYHLAMEEFRLHDALAHTWALVRYADKRVDEEKLWELAKEHTRKFQEILAELCVLLATIAWMIRPFMPSTAGHMYAQLGIEPDQKEEWEFSLKKGEALFPRIL